MRLESGEGAVAQTLEVRRASEIDLVNEEKDKRGTRWM